MIAFIRDMLNAAHATPDEHEKSTASPVIALHLTEKLQPEMAEDAFNQAADNLLKVAKRAAKAAMRRGDKIDATLAQIRALRAEPVV